MDIPFYPLEKINVTNTCPDVELIDLAEAFLRSRQDVYGAHRHDYFETFFFTQAQGQIRVDFKEYTLEAPGFLMVRPGQVHQWFLGQNPQGWILRFDRQWVDPQTLPRDLGCPALVPLKKEEAQDFQALGHLIQRAYHREDCPADQLLRPLVNLWVKHFSLTLPALNPPAGPRGTVSQRFLDLVESSYTRGLRTKAMAKELGLSESRLFWVVKKELGQTPGEIVRQRILLEARRLLAITDQPVNEISWALGFEDPAYFSRYFHQVLGLPPLAYRHQEREMREKS